MKIVMSRTHKDTRQYREKVIRSGQSVKVFCGGIISSKYKRAHRKIRRVKEKDAFRGGKIVPLFMVWEDRMSGIGGRLVRDLLLVQLHPYNTLEEVGAVELEIYELIVKMREKGDIREKEREALERRRKRRKG